MFRWLLALIGLVAVVVVGGYFVLKRPDIPYETLAVTYESPASRYVDLPGGVHMHYRVDGAPGDAPTLLLIHGFSDAVQTWEPWVRQLNDLSANGYRIISIDLPGHGLTRAPAGYRASINAFRDAVYAFAQSQHLTHFAIAGNSMGGNVAWEYALAHPDQLTGLILVDSAGWSHPTDEGALNSPMMKLLRSPVGPYLRDLDNTALFRRGVQAAFADPAHASEEMVTRFVTLSRAPGHRDILLQMQTNRNARRAASNEVLAPITTPTLILWGDQDHLIPVGDAELFHTAIHGSEVKIYHNVGHMPQNEATEQSASDVHEFLYRIVEGSALAPGQAVE